MFNSSTYLKRRFDPISFIAHGHGRACDNHGSLSLMIASKLHPTICVNNVCCLGQALSSFSNYECVHNLSPAYFSNFFIWIENVHSFSTRQSKRGDLFALRCNTTQYGLRSIHYSGVRLWNSLPTDVRNSVSLSIFRSKIKTYFLSNYSTI